MASSSAADVTVHLLILYLLSTDVLVVLGSPVITPLDIPVELGSLREFVILVSDDVTCSHPEIDRSQVDSPPPQCRSDKTDRDDLICRTTR